LNIPAVTNEDIIRYTKMFNKLNPALEKLMEETNQRTDVLPCIQRDTACFLQFIIQREKPLKILELGTAVGISTITMALVLPENGHITTVERGHMFVAEAEKNFENFKLNHKITQILGDVTEVVPNLQGDFDLIFQDSGKQTYLPLLDDLVRLLRPGGLLIADDTLFPAMDLPERNQKSQRAVNRFNQAVFAHPRLKSFILPIGHGITIAEKDKNS